MSLLALAMTGRSIRGTIQINGDEILQNNEEFRPAILRER